MTKASGITQPKDILERATALANHGMQSPWQTIDPVTVTETTVNSVIQKLDDQPELREDNWCLSPQAAKILYLLAASVENPLIVEVGTSIGYSTLWLAKAAEQNNGHIHTIDVDPIRQGIARAYCQEAHVENLVTFHTGKALDCLAQLHHLTPKPQVNLVFIDAAKGEYLAYVESILPLLSPGAFVVADNTQSHRRQMMNFIAYMDTTDVFDSDEIDTPAGLIVAQKR